MRTLSRHKVSCSTLLEPRYVTAAASEPSSQSDSVFKVIKRVPIQHYFPYNSENPIDEGLIDCPDYCRTYKASIPASAGWRHTYPVHVKEIDKLTAWNDTNGGWDRAQAEAGMLLYFPLLKSPHLIRGIDVVESDTKCCTSGMILLMGN